MTDERKEILEALENLKSNREEQLERESHNSYNYGHVAGEVSGIHKAIKAIRNPSKS